MKKRLAQWMISILVFSAIGFGLYQHFRSEASERVKAGIVRFLDQTPLSQGDREVTTRLISEVHEEAFDEALNISRTSGAKFDNERYVDEIFARIVERAREEGLTELATTLKEVHSNITIREPRH